MMRPFRLSNPVEIYPPDACAVASERSVDYQCESSRESKIDDGVGSDRKSLGFSRVQIHSQGDLSPLTRFLVCA